MKISKNYFKIKDETQKEKLKKFHMDIASSIQAVLEEVVLLICKYLKKNSKRIIYV